MRLLAVVGCVAFCAASGLAHGEGESKRAREILQKAVEALNNVQYVSYDFEYKGTGFMARRGGEATGKVMLGPPSEWGIAQLYCEADVENPSSKNPDKFTIGCDGDVYFFTDHQKKTVYEDMDSAVLGTKGRNLQQLIVTVFVDADPLKRALESKAVTMRKDKTIGDKDCYQVVVKGQRGSDVAWLIAKDDYLPRARNQVFEGRGRKGSRSFTITNLKVLSKVNGNPFVAKVPDGYKKTDDFAR